MLGACGDYYCVGDSAAGAGDEGGGLEGGGSDGWMNVLSFLVVLGGMGLRVSFGLVSWDSMSNFRNNYPLRLPQATASYMEQKSK